MSEKFLNVFSLLFFDVFKQFIYLLGRQVAQDVSSLIRRHLLYDVSSLFSVHGIDEVCLHLWL